MSTARATWDLHCHCLHGLDDGPATLAESLALCSALVDDGIRTVIATPHQFGRYEQNTGLLIRRQVDALQAVLDERQVPLRVLPGADVRIDERIVPGLADGSVVSVGDGHQAVLLEIPHTTFIDPLPLVQMLKARGIVSVITHPERHSTVVKEPERWTRRWVEAGAVLQVTAGSLLGEFGPGAEQVGWRIIETYWRSSLLASDAHDTQRRPPRLSAATREVERRLGTAVAMQVADVVPRWLVGNVLPENVLRRQRALARRAAETGRRPM